MARQRAAWALLLVLASLDKRASATTRVNKCCADGEMLSGDGRACVPANRSVDAVHWWPPGVPSPSSDAVRWRFLNAYFQQFIVVPVNASGVWSPQRPTPVDDWWKGRMVLKDGHHNVVVRPRRDGAGVRETVMYCVDAAMPPLAPFAVLVELSAWSCEDDGECVRKCCQAEEVLEERDGHWECRMDPRGYWSPYNSSFTRFVDPETPFIYQVAVYCLQGEPQGLRLERGEREAAELIRRDSHDFQFAIWETCADFEVTRNNSLRETLVYCMYSRVTRAVYWLVRPLCCVSLALLTVTLVSIACNSRTRHTLHSWCLACHAACLLAFNLAQVTYYATISDSIDSYGRAPLKLQATCEVFAFVIHFLMTAASSWLTAVCINMSLGFKKLKVVRPGSGGDRKRFVFLSVFAWGVPTVLTSTAALVYKSHQRSPGATNVWFSPTLVETRTCFVEFGLSWHEKHWYTARKTGTALFYYGPAALFVVANIVFLARTLKQVRFLRRGNSVLRREEDRVPAPQGGGERPREALADSAHGRPKGERKGSSSATRSDADTVRMYMKMLLMTGGVEILVESIGWASSNYFRHADVPHMSTFLDHALPYRVTGYVTDCFRAACVAWLAAPEGGYVAALRRWLREAGAPAGGGAARTTNRHVAV